MDEKRLLVVDDEPEFGEYVRKVAVELGYEVEVTGDGKSFMKAYESFNPSVIALDLVMPEIDGVELDGLGISRPHKQVQRGGHAGQLDGEAGGAGCHLDGKALVEARNLRADRRFQADRSWRRILTHRAEDNRRRGLLAVAR